MNERFKVFYIEFTSNNVYETGMANVKSKDFTDVLEAYHYIKDIESKHERNKLLGDINGISIKEIERKIKLSEL